MSAKSEAMKQARQDGYVIVRADQQPIVAAWARRTTADRVPTVILQEDRPGWAFLLVSTAHLEGPDAMAPIRATMRGYLPQRKLVTIVEHNPVTTAVLRMPIWHAKQLAAQIVALHARERAAV